MWMASWRDPGQPGLKSRERRAGPRIPAATALLYLILQGLDVLSTEMNLAAGAYEVNPLARAVLEAHGAELMYLLKLFVILAGLLAVLIWARRWAGAWWAIRIVNWGMLVVVGINIFNLVAC